MYETQTELSEAREELELVKLKLDVADQEAQAAKRQAAEATAATAALLQAHDSPGLPSPVNRRSLSREVCAHLCLYVCVCLSVCVCRRGVVCLSLCVRACVRVHVHVEWTAPSCTRLPRLRPITVYGIIPCTLLSTVPVGRSTACS